MAMSHGGNPLFWKAKDYTTPRDEISVQIGCCLVFVTEFATTTSGKGCIYHRLFSEQWICIGSTYDGCVTFSNASCGRSSG